MIVSNLTPNRIRCVHEDNSRLAFILMPKGHEKDTVSLKEMEWDESTRLVKLQKKGYVQLAPGVTKKPVAIPVPEMDGLDKAQRAMLNALVLGSDTEHRAYIEMLPLDNRSTMPNRVNYKYIRDKMVPVFEMAAEWLHAIGNKQRESAVKNRAKELRDLVKDKG